MFPTRFLRLFVLLGALCASAMPVARAQGLRDSDDSRSLRSEHRRDLADLGSYSFAHSIGLHSFLRGSHFLNFDDPFDFERLGVVRSRGSHHVRIPLLPTDSDSSATTASGPGGSVSDYTPTFDLGLFNGASAPAGGNSKSSGTSLLSASAGGTELDFLLGASADLTRKQNYTSNTTPSAAFDILLKSTTTSLTIDSSSLSMGSINATNGKSYSVSNTSPGTTSTLTLGGSGSNAIAGASANDIIFLSGNSSLNFQAQNPGTLNISLASSGNFDVGSGSTLTIGSSITGSGKTVSLTGAGTTILSGANSYGTIGAVGTFVNAGTLLINNTTGSGTGLGNVTVNGSGTTLGGTGIISGTVTVGNTAASAIINPGPKGTNGTAGAVGTLTTGALTLTGSDIFHIDASGTLAGNWDKLSVNGSATLGTLSTFQLSIASGLNFTAGTVYTLIDATTITGSFSGYADNTQYNIGGYDFIVHYNLGGDGNFELTAVPEPGTWAAGFVAVGAVAFSQRRRLRKSLLAA